MEDKTNQWERWFWRSKVKEQCKYYEAKAAAPPFTPSGRSSKEKFFCIHPHSQHDNRTVFPPCGGDKVKCDIPRRKRIV